MNGERRPIAPFLLLLLALLLPACAASPPLPADPGEVRFDPRHATATVKLGNPGPTPRSITGLRIEGEDWVAFQIVNEHNPDRIGPGSSVEIELRVDRNAFRTDLAPPGEKAAPQAGYAAFREGAAQLRFELDGEAGSVPLHFAPASRGTGFASVLAGLMGLAALGLALAIRTLPGRRSDRGREAVWPLREPGPVLVLATLVLAWCALPLSSAICTGALAHPVGELGLARCREGLGGGVGAALTGPLAAFASVVALGLAPILGEDRPRDASTRLAPLLGTLALALCVSAVALSSGDLDANGWIEHQLRSSVPLPRTSVPVPGWSLLQLPVPALLAATALVFAHDRNGPGWLTVTRDVVASALVAVAFLGGLQIALPTSWPHGLVLLCRALCFGAGTGAIALGVATARARLEAPTEPDRGVRIAGALAVLAALWLVFQVLGVVVAGAAAAGPGA